MYAGGFLDTIFKDDARVTCARRLSPTINSTLEAEGSIASKLRFPNVTEI